MGSKSSKSSTKEEDAVRIRTRSREAPIAWGENFNAINLNPRPDLFGVEHCRSASNELVNIRKRMEQEKMQHGDNSIVYNKLVNQEAILREVIHIGPRPCELERAYKMGTKLAEFYHLDVQTRKY